ncbi:MAG: hypothetical protein MJZ12_00010 [Prevotella sp.]|nr:hypothetical protein [Prevotella sp.]
MTALEVGEFCRTTAFPNDLIVYEDKEGNMHEIFGARRVRADGIPYIILSETYRGFEFKTERADRVLTETLNEFNENYFNHRDGKM